MNTPTPPTTAELRIAFSRDQAKQQNPTAKQEAAMQKLTRDHELSGKVIRDIYQSRDGHEMVLVFEDDDWAVFCVEDNYTDDAAVSLELASSGAYGDIKQYLLPDDLLAAHLLTQEQYTFLVNENKRDKAKKLRVRAEQLIDEADRIDRVAAV